MKNNHLLFLNPDGKTGFYLTKGDIVEFRRYGKNVFGEVKEVNNSRSVVIVKAKQGEYETEILNKQIKKAAQSIKNKEAAEFNLNAAQLLKEITLNK